MPAINTYGVTSATAKAFRALNNFGMNLADFAALSTGVVYPGFGNGTGYTVSNWISDGYFANLAAVQSVYPICQSGSDTVDWVLLQSAVDFMIYGSLGSSNFKTTKHRLFIPAGAFRCNRPLQIGYARAGTPPAALNGNGYVSITIEGEGLQYDTSGNGMTGTVITFPYTNDVGIATNKGVYVHIKNMTIQGGYTYNDSFTGFNSYNKWDEAAWKDPSLPSKNWLGGSAVNIGVAIDPYYPTTTDYPARPLPASFGGGTTTYTSENGGSGTFLENVSIVNFVIGYGRPHGDGNGEFISHWGGKYNACVYGISIGASQARNNSFRDLDFFNFHTAFTNEGGTRTIGNLHGNYQNIHAAYGHQLFKNTSGGWTGPIDLRDVYMEGSASIGSVGTARITNGYFSFYESEGTRGSEEYHIKSTGLVSLDNCLFSTFRGLTVSQTGLANARLTMNNSAVIVRSWSDAGDVAYAEAYNGLIYIGGVHARFSGGRYGANNFVTSGSDANFLGPDVIRRQNFTHLAQEYVDFTPSRFGFEAGESAGSNTLTGGQYRFVVPKIVHNQMNMGVLTSRTGYDVVSERITIGNVKADIGDIFYVGDSGQGNTAFLVIAISGSNMTMRQLNNYHGTSSGDYQTNGKTQPAAGVLYYGKYICTRIRRNTGLITGTVTSGSNVITNVKHALGSGNAVSTSELQMAVGDLFIHQEIERLNVGGSPISPLNKVTAIDTTAQTITLTDNFNISQTNYPVVFYVKVHNA